MYDPNYVEFGTPSGWRCPSCGRVYSPSTSMCYYCGGNQRITYSTTSAGSGEAEWWRRYQQESTTSNFDEQIKQWTKLLNNFPTDSGFQNKWRSIFGDKDDN